MAKIRAADLQIISGRRSILGLEKTLKQVGRLAIEH